jgi:hypothetical protein
LYNGKNVTANTKKAWQLQRNLGWKEIISQKQFEEFVSLYKDYKVVVLNYNCLKGISYTGEKYVYDKENEKKKIIYIYAAYYGVSNKCHFALLSSPLVQILNSRRSNYKWCYYCDIAFLLSEGHECSMNVIQMIKVQ